MISHTGTETRSRLQNRRLQWGILDNERKLDLAISHAIYNRKMCTSEMDVIVLGTLDVKQLISPG
jgi:hypothetical protein